MSLQRKALEILSGSITDLECLRSRMDIEAQAFHRDMLAEMVKRHGYYTVEQWFTALRPDSMEADEAAHADKRGTGVRKSWAGD